MVFAESMRLYPPAWAMGRQSTAPIALGPYRFPAKTYFFFSQYVMQRDPEYFPDPLRFDPERFTPEAKAARPRFAYFPFGGGARQCIGESFAWMEGVLILATIAQQVAAAACCPISRSTCSPRSRCGRSIRSTCGWKRDRTYCPSFLLRRMIRLSF